MTNLHRNTFAKIRQKWKFWHGLPSIDKILQYNIPNHMLFIHQNKHKHTTGQHILNIHMYATMNSPFLSKQDWNKNFARGYPLFATILQFNIPISWQAGQVQLHLNKQLPNKILNQGENTNLHWLSSWSLMRTSLTQKQATLTKLIEKSNQNFQYWLLL